MPLFLFPLFLYIILVQNACILRYWSYEWCYKETFKQFHVSAKTETFSSNVKHENWEKLAAESKNQKYAIVYSIESLIILGHYKSQNFQVAIISNGSGNSFDGDANSDDRLSVIVHQVYDDGDYCESSNKPRKVNVELRCCTKDEMSRLGIRYKKAVTQDDNGLQQQQRVTPKAFMVDIQEIPSMVCEYQATVCSPILCQEEIMSNDDDSYHNYGSMEKLLEKHYIESQLPTNAINNINEKESIRQILERALGNVCLQRNEGW